MNSSRHILISGAGLAGSFLSAHLIREGFRVTLIDDDAPSSASKVAGGLFNYVTGRSMLLTWKAMELRECLDHFLSDPFFAGFREYFHLVPVYFPFKTAGSFNQWTSISPDSPHASFVKIHTSPKHENQIHNPLGGLEVIHAGWAETGRFVNAVRNWVGQQPGCRWINGRLDPRQVDPSKGIARVNGEEIGFQHLVFCEGVRIKQNHFFEGLPVDLLKGQILELEIPGFEPDFILTGGVFVLQTGKGRFIAGSTYERTFTDEGPDDAGKKELSLALEASLKIPWKITGMRSGVRPTTPDRRPILGTHPSFSNLHLINGLGTKGVLHAPWCAIRMTEKLSEKIGNFEKETDLLRYSSKMRNL